MCAAAGYINSSNGPPVKGSDGGFSSTNDSGHPAEGDRLSVSVLSSVDGALSVNSKIARRLMAFDSTSPRIGQLQSAKGVGTAGSASKRALQDDVTARVEDNGESVSEGTCRLNPVVH